VITRRGFFAAVGALVAAPFVAAWARARPVAWRMHLVNSRWNGDWVCIIGADQEHDLRVMSAREEWAAAYRAYRGDGGAGLDARAVYARYRHRPTLDGVIHRYSGIDIVR
jgi:hypothetical protein